MMMSPKRCALRTGIANAQKNLIFYTHGAAQYDARELEKMLPLLTEGVDMVNDYKLGRSLMILHTRSVRRASGLVLTA